MKRLLDFGKRRKSMCLDSVTKSLEQSTLIESGYKEFSEAAGGPEFQAMTLNGKRKVPLDQWITAEETPTPGKYVSGFHIYIREKEHIKTKLRRVYFRNAHTKGQQREKTIVIAKEMYVPSDPNA